MSFGNPYPTAIDFRTIFNPSIAQSFIVWNPDSLGGYGVGKFETYIYNTQTLHFQKTTSNEIRDSIQSGEAVFIQSFTGGSITVKESDKVGESRLVSRNSADASMTTVIAPSLEINLFVINADGSQLLSDGALMNFDNGYSNSIDNRDVRKIENSVNNISIQKGTFKLVAERRNNLAVTDTIFLSITNTRVAAYRLEIDPSVLANLPLRAFLRDKFLGSETAVSFTDVTNINFNITTDPASRVADRFMIFFKRAWLLDNYPDNSFALMLKKILIKQIP